MINEERAALLLDKYGDDLYRFAYILTLSEDTAGHAVSDAFAEASGRGLLSNSDKDDKKLLFSLIYKNTAKCKPGSFDEDKYGKKSETFYEIIKLPLKERASNHLALYEDMAEQDIKEVIKAK